ncbi:SDR family NAD(P)-dependent oxidoreductase [Brevundimonas sp. NIBR11]|uniref:SDR family NAD(P)-dependent oxidoreductase n=1 Tax=Brevundimonas sp. NIBR11 TaxID=3015999 RepID=UPI0022F00DBF|nr:SDR family NAD(P)-dependent oxidoreductase [Brevundimonas sp. NIBR11]WGM30717.1 3-oxoacyl-[acyl-carrier-protein] reductase FabG [Brevundimonas sp. NIBR11]
MRFKDRDILVTGGSGALGGRVVEQMKREGGRVTVIARAPMTGQATLVGDLSTEHGLEAVAAEVAERPWDLLVNIAGIQHFGPLEHQTPEHLLASYMVNLIAPARLAQAVLPGMKSRGRGQIANVGSIFGSINFAHFATYSSAKAGMRALSQSLRRELSGTGVDVTYVAPRAVATPFNSDRVNEFARLTGMAVDDPDRIARRIASAIRKNRRDVYLGFPESLFVRLNALSPSLIDGALKSNDLKARALFAG